MYKKGTLRHTKWTHMIRDWSLEILADDRCQDYWPLVDRVVMATSVDELQEIDRDRIAIKLDGSRNMQARHHNEVDRLINLRLKRLADVEGCQLYDRGEITIECCHAIISAWRLTDKLDNLERAKSGTWTETPAPRPVEVLPAEKTFQVVWYDKDHKVLKEFYPLAFNADLALSKVLADNRFTFWENTFFIVRYCGRTWISSFLERLRITDLYEIPRAPEDTTTGDNQP